MRGRSQKVKHPGPWRLGPLSYRFKQPQWVEDANGRTILCPYNDESLMRLILAAPELLDHLKMHVLARRDESAESEGLRDSEALIARIEGGG